MKVAIHQPNFMPWAGYFKKIADCDVFVFLDDVKCSKNSFFNRNRFSVGKKLDSFFWLNCPVSKKNYKINICDVFVDKSFIKKHKKYFEMRHSRTSETELLAAILSAYDFAWENTPDQLQLSEFNITMCKTICDYLEISKKTKMIRSSDIKLFNRASLNKQSLIIEIVKAVNGKTYISGSGAKSYQSYEDFKAAGIELIYQSVQQEKLLKIAEENISFVDIVLIEGICKAKKMILD